jgi:hypothetical protein
MYKKKLMSLLFNKLPYLVSMMDTAVIEYKYAMRPWEWISEGYLNYRTVCLVPDMMNLEAKPCTTFSCKNCTNLSDFTEPSTISHVIRPSRVSTGRIE